MGSVTVGGSGTTSLTLLACVSHGVVVDQTMVNNHNTIRQLLMSTYSRLTVSEQERFWERYNVAVNRYGISRQDYKALALEEHRLQRWSEQECNGEIQRDDETGIPFRCIGFGYTATGNAYVIPDREKGCIRRCEEIAASYGLKFFHQTDPRGCQVHVYRESDLQGSDIRSVYPTQAHAIFF